MKIDRNLFRTFALAALVAAGTARTSLAEANGGASGRWIEAAPGQIELHAMAFDAEGLRAFRFDLLADAAAVGKSRVRGTATLVPYPGQPALTETLYVVGILDRRADGTAALRAALAKDGAGGLELVGSMLGVLTPIGAESLAVAPASADVAPLEPDADVVEIAPEDSQFVPRRGEFRARWRMN